MNNLISTRWHLLFVICSFVPLFAFGSRTPIFFQRPMSKLLLASLAVAMAAVVLYNRNPTAAFDDGDDVSGSVAKPLGRRVNFKNFGSVEVARLPTQPHSTGSGLWSVTPGTLMRVGEDGRIRMMIGLTQGLNEKRRKRVAENLGLSPEALVAHALDGGAGYIVAVPTGKAEGEIWEWTGYKDIEWAAGFGVEEAFLEPLLLSFVNGASGLPSEWLRRPLTALLADGTVSTPPGAVRVSNTKVAYGPEAWGVDEVKSLSEHDGVVWVEVSRVGVPMNRATRGVLGIPSASDPWGEVLKGDGQLVSIGDSGVDLEACALRDSTVNATIVTGPTVLPADNGHRKIYAVWQVNDVSDSGEIDGSHGTATIGTVAGINESPGSSGNDWRGMVSDARVLVLDAWPGECREELCGCTYVSGSNTTCCSESMGLPLDLNKNWWSWGYSLGARVHVDSWGAPEQDGDGGAYTLSAREADEFSASHRDWIGVFAAGNGGASGLYTVAAPGTSKNGITVGACQTTPDGFEDALRFMNWDRVIADVASQAAADVCDSCELGCNSTANTECTYWREEFNSTDVCCDNLDTARFCCPSVVNATTVGDFERANSENVPEWSARGPTRDGRIKPDVIAPGVGVVSAGGECGLSSSAEDTLQTTVSGTSSSAASVAGAAVAVRQYFMDGYYPSGALNEDDAHTPSGALIKAMVIASSSTPNGLVGVGTEAWVTTDELVGRAETVGWGRVDLSSVLHFQEAYENEERTAAQVYVIDEGPDGALDSGETRTICVRVTDDSLPLQAVLAWSDPPGSPLSGGTMLVNDLDVLGCRGDQTYSVTPQSVNSAEVLRLGAETGLWSFTVRAGESLSSKQPWALVLTGAQFDIPDACGACPRAPPVQVSLSRVIWVAVGCFLFGGLFVGAVILWVRWRATRAVMDGWSRGTQSANYQQVTETEEANNE